MCIRNNTVAALHKQCKKLPAVICGQPFRSPDEDWLGSLDSNQDRQIQSLQCYRYTTPQHKMEFLEFRVERVELLA